MQTPRHIGSKVDKAINDLNAQWDLGLPRLHGREAVEAEAKGPLATKCASRIRFLCFRTEEIDHLLSGFQERARQQYSRWIWKPSQERGTLPILPVSKSLLSKDVETKRESGLIRLSESQRQELLKLLYDVLDEQFQLARMSESFSYERPVEASVSAAPAPAPVTPRKAVLSQMATKPSHQDIPKGNKMTSESGEPEARDPLARSGKRSLGSPEGKNKRQLRLSQFEFHRKTSPPCPDPVLRPDTTSFETIPSARVSSVFTTADEMNDSFASNDTSMVSAVQDDSQNLFTTQEYQDLMADEEFSTSFDMACLVPTSSDPLDLTQNTPFKRSALLPSEVPYWYCWEIHRVASALGLVPIDVYKAIQKSLRPSDLCYDEVWTALKKFCLENGLKSMIPKSELPNWAAVENQYENPQLNKVVYLTGTLDWDPEPSRGLFTFRQNEIHLEESCRLHRKFGADRFLVISAPDFSRRPKQSRQMDEEILHQKITDFLTAGRHFIAGRYWRVFWIEQEKKKKKKKEQAPPGQKVYMFAEAGYDMLGRDSQDLNAPSLKVNGHHRQLTVEDIMQWHMPIEANIKSTDLKLFSRWAIALSKTTPTIVLKPDEFVYLRDPPGAVVMNDGCSRMSYALARDIWAKCGGEGLVPSAVQGRIGGAKGLWLVDYSNANLAESDRHYWIEVSDSQLKIKPHPRHRLDADEHQRTFEVLKFAGECKPAHLNMQLITVLADRGVPRETLQELLKTDTKSYSDSLMTSMSDPKALRLWMQEQGVSHRSQVRKLLASFPIEHGEQMKLLLESDFHPQECARLKELAYSFLSEYMTNYVEKLWINVPCSTVAFCAPDPLNILEEDEVFINFSSPVEDPRKDYPETMLDGLDVLVARNPAYLPSDMQRRRAVYKHELRHYKNVILFPVKGERPLASLLSGGDYDGDTVTVIWAPAIVDQFQNARPPKLPNEEQCGMVQQSRPLSSIFDGVQSPAEAIQDFLRGCVSFNARPSLMGVCSSEHEKLVYSLSQTSKGGKLSNQGALTLAALAGYLVDSNKQGWGLTQKDFYLVRRNASGRNRLPEPAFKEKTAPRKILGTFPNVIDFLKFEVAENCKDRALAEFQKLYPKARFYHGELSEVWRKAESKANEETAARVDESKTRNTMTNRHKRQGTILKDGPQVTGTSTTPRLKDLLHGPDGLMAQIKELELMAAKLVAVHNAVDSTPANPTDRKRFNADVQALYERYVSIEPKQVDHELRRRFEEERDHPFAYWSLLRASCLHYRVCSKGRIPTWVWYVAGRELCILKTFHHKGEVRLMTAEMYNILKLDSKFTRGLLEGSETEANDVFYDAADGPSWNGDDVGDDDDEV